MEKTNMDNPSSVEMKEASSSPFGTCSNQPPVEVEEKLTFQQLRQEAIQRARQKDLTFWTKEKIDQLVKTLNKGLEQTELRMLYNIDASKISFSFNEVAILDNFTPRIGHAERLILPFQVRDAIYDTFKEWCVKNSFFIMNVHVYHRGQYLYVRFDVHLSEPFDPNLLTILTEGCAFVEK